MGHTNFIMTEKWIFTGLLAIALYMYAIYVLVAETPFFIGTVFTKYKPFEWVYVEFGALTLSGILFSLGLLFTKWSYKESKEVTNVEEAGKSVLSTIHLVIGLVIILGYIVL